jgi:uncharacterized protein (DUF2126 family)
MDFLGRRGATRFAASLVVVSLVGTIGHAAELQDQTRAAFDRYVEATEARMARERAGDSPFLWIDRQSESERTDADGRLHGGEVVIERLETRDAGRKQIKIPKGMVWY